MILCDKCKKTLEKHRVIEFGYVGTVWEKIRIGTYAKNVKKRC